MFPTNAFNGLSLPGGAYGLLEWRPAPPPGVYTPPEPTINVLKVGAVLLSDGTPERVRSR